MSSAEEGEGRGDGDCRGHCRNRFRHATTIPLRCSACMQHPGGKWVAANLHRRCRRRVSVTLLDGTPAGDLDAAGFRGILRRLQ